MYNLNGIRERTETFVGIGGRFIEELSSRPYRDVTFLTVKGDQVEALIEDESTKITGTVQEFITLLQLQGFNPNIGSLSLTAKTYVDLNTIVPFLKSANSIYLLDVETDVKMLPYEFEQSISTVQRLVLNEAYHLETIPNFLNFTKLEFLNVEQSLNNENLNYLNAERLVAYLKKEDRGIQSFKVISDEPGFLQLVERFVRQSRTLRRTVQQIERDEGLVKIEFIQSLEDDAPDFQTGDGLAWEVHNKFRKTYTAFRRNYVPRMKAFVGDWDVAWGDARMQDEREKAGRFDREAHRSRFNVLYAYLKHMIDVVHPTTWVGWLFSSQDDGKAEKHRQLDRIFQSLDDAEASISGQVYAYAVLAMKFVLKLNNPVLTEEYVSRFLDECVNAYSGGNNGMSCVRGIRERLILVFDSAFVFVCCQEALCETTNIEGMCPVSTDLLVGAVEPVEPWNTYVRQWSMNESLPFAGRRENFLESMTSRYTEGINDEDAIEAVREAVKRRLEAMERNGTVNFECLETIDVFTDPIDCEKPQPPQCCCMVGNRRCRRKPASGSKFCTQHKKAIDKNGGKCSKNNGPAPWC